MSYQKEFDVETAPAEKPTFVNETDSAEFIGDDGAVPAETFIVGDSFYAKAQRLAGKFGVEQRGIERVPSDERLPAGMSQIGTLVSLSKLMKMWGLALIKIVAFCQHGRLRLRHWSSGLPSILPWIYRYHLNHILCEYSWHNSCQLLLDFWPTIRPPTNGSIPFLLWMVWRENQ